MSTEGGREGGREGGGREGGGCTRRGFTAHRCVHLTSY